MPKYCLCVLAGGWLLTCLARLPAPDLRPALMLGCAALACWPATRTVAAVLAGALLLWSASARQLADNLSATQSRKDFIFNAQIIDFSKLEADSARLLVAPDAAAGLPARLRLSWYGAERVPRIGEQWRFSARLRMPRGFANPGGFDYAGWLFRQRIGATGYVRHGEWLGDAPTHVTRVRRAVVERISALLPDDEARAVLLAITVGARHRIGREAWARYAATGTTHLMAISGLHIGLAAGAAFALGRLLLALLLPRANGRHAALLVALVAAAAYAEIAGFAVPARRALLMAALATAAVLLRRRPSAPRVLALSCLLIVIADPFAMLAPGFMLSFAAVTVLLWTAARAAHPPASRRWPARLALAVGRLGSLQAALLFGLFPLTALLFARLSIIAPLANLVVLPVFSLITVPAGLLGVLAGGPLAVLGDAAFWCCWQSLRAVLVLLHELEQLPGAHWPLAELRGMAAAGAALAALWVLLPPGWPGRRLAWPALLAALMYRPATPPEPCVEITVLDVGQGQAAVVRTARHTLVFDTGPGFRSAADTAQLVLLPYLQSVGERRVDVVVVSHADQDHAGGLQSLLAGTNVGQIFAGEPLGGLAVPELPCHAGTRWNWDGVEFALLSPGAEDAWTGNNASCVLSVAAGRYRALLTGDIERPVESRLYDRGLLSTSDVVLVPHHGSRTSSSTALVSAVRPRHAIVSAGFENRWGFPKPDIVARWQRAGADVATTAIAGAVEIRLCGAGGVQRVVYWRERLRRFWHAAPG